MKKRVFAVIAALTLTLGMSVTAFAKDTAHPSKEGQTTTPTTAPATGEDMAVFYGIGAAALLAGTAVISRKKLEEAK